ncbi:hypothetical protein [Baia soyae]|uniref:Uncharacterized protein n=1 Tax=Baia soyae TaxID=1544746 RepID=A0A4R2RX78_9BACL|nr:hypothetical protein [Baia soyae]TCP63735.1 hypothetical protein EDD57_1479 [Baia soyae]
MYVTKPVHMTHKVKPNTTYKVDFDFDIATNEAAGSFGIGGSPASSLHVKAGASIVDPQTYVKDGYNRLNIDHGHQKNDGKNTIRIGDLGKLHTTDKSYEIKNFKNESRPFYIKSDSKGQLWLVVGTDSGYEGITKYYIPRIKATLTEAPSK